MASPIPLREVQLTDEIEQIARVLESAGPLERAELARRANAREMGPGCFSKALGEAVATGRVRRESRRIYAPVEGGAPADS